MIKCHLSDYELRGILLGPRGSHLRLMQRRARVTVNLAQHEDGVELQFRPLTESSYDAIVSSLSDLDSHAGFAMEDD